jgi:DNA repair exonuclease SbcCD ATPase subunit
MKPISISLKNYKRYGDTETTLDLSGNKVRVISGKMGVGKTSFVDAIIWVLFNKSLTSADGVVNRAVNKNCKVEFNFIIDKNEYSIIRYRKHDEYKNNVLLFQNGKNISGADTKKTQELIENIIGISYRAMISSVIFSSEIYISFLRSKGYSERLKILENILNLGIVNKWLDSTKKLMKPIQDKIEEYESKIDKIDYGVETIENNISDYKEKSKEKLLEIKKKKTFLESSIETLKQEIKNLEKIDVTAEIEKIKSFNSIKENNDYLNSKIKEEVLNLYDINKILEEINELKNKQDVISRVDIDKEIKTQEQYNNLLENKKEIETKIKDLMIQKIDVSFFEIEINKSENNIENLKKEISSIEHEASCPLCGQGITQQKSEELVCIKKEELEKNKNIILKNNEELKKANEKNLNLKEKIQILYTQIPDFEEKFFDRSLEELKDLKEQKNTISFKIAEKEKDFLQKEDWNNKTQSRINNLKLEIREEGEKPFHDLDFLNDLNREINEKKESLKEYENELKNISENARNAYDKEYVEELQDKIKKLKTSKIKTEKFLNDKNKELEYYIFFSNMFANKEGGIKKEVIGRMISAFNSKVNFYIPYFMPNDRSGISIEFDNNLKEKIIENGQEIEYESFSSGEKTVLEISVAFSLFMLAKEFFSSSISFIVFDEILDGNLDDEASAKVAKVVNDLGESNSVMLISHRKDLKESFDTHVIIEKDKKGFSYIKA